MIHPGSLTADRVRLGKHEERSPAQRLTPLDYTLTDAAVVAVSNPLGQAVIYRCLGSWSIVMGRKRSRQGGRSGSWGLSHPLGCRLPDAGLWSNYPHDQDRTTCKVGSSQRALQGQDRKHTLPGVLIHSLGHVACHHRASAARPDETAWNYHAGRGRTRYID